MRTSGRENDELRAIEIIPNYLVYAEGSCLISFGQTRVLCAATIEDRVPPFLRGSGHGWITAEYSLLPRSTQTRTEREAVKGKQSGRTQEVQRLIGRSLRASLDLAIFGEKQIKIDCDVIQADGGTRTASICGACIAVGLAVKQMGPKQNPFKHLVGAVSCGILNGQVIVDLDYSEDFHTETDANFVMIDTGELVEIQATAEKGTFKDGQLMEMISSARQGINHIFQLQKDILLK
ncbi:MAG: ribonuclease PH [Holosporaceae bacterium]|jgi:ribonuclease PH|nr:ribonuclease PH [Holosporaceae bacterium]